MPVNILILLHYPAIAVTSSFSPWTSGTMDKPVQKLLSCSAQCWGRAEAKQLNHREQEQRLMGSWTLAMDTATSELDEEGAKDREERVIVLKNVFCMSTTSSQSSPSPVSANKPTHTNQGRHPCEK